MKLVQLKEIRNPKSYDPMNTPLAVNPQHITSLCWADSLTISGVYTGTAIISMDDGITYRVIGDVSGLTERINAALEGGDGHADG